MKSIHNIWTHPKIGNQKLKYIVSQWFMLLDLAENSHYMRYLKQVHDLIGSQKPDTIAHLPERALPFLDLVKSGNIIEDKEGINQLFGDSKNGSTYYFRLKSKVSDSLLNTYLCTKTEQTEIQKMYSKCHKEYAVFEKLVAAGEWPIARKLGERLIKNTIKHHFTLLTYSVARKLKRHFASVLAERKKYLHYTQVVNQYKELLEAEEIAEDYYCELSSHFIRTKNPRIDLIPLANQAIEELSELSKQHESYWFNLFLYTIRVIREELNQNYKAVAQISEEALNYFKSLAYLAPYASFVTFCYKSAFALIQLKNLAKAKERIEWGLELAPVGGHNWIEMLKIKVKLEFHQKDYEAAYKSICKGKKYAKGANQEQFRIFEAYIQYFIHTGVLEIEDKSKFRLHKFLNEVPTFTKDKKGNNIPILLVQILFYLANEEYSKVIGRLDALKIYTKRYLDNKSTIRSKYFLDLLLLFAECDFEVASFFNKSKQLRQQLVSTPLDVQDSDIEIVPYEHLLEGVVESLSVKPF